ncbi:hypothetical protein [Oharaeibacter diazotrophicus]|uniref:Uncharacterized protein n=1 Tax=Oharaeibacter diazotrophicus TaxID=1920512 RepID=A0A4R6RG61_9HYPH|nr:hypothetical protein [Oharaeibacter diazotrophicus]TDP85411.1 hypothetical protein EDD54_2264 [Oharaeibacter diazotrophicus]BBE74381.1 hypothetical protein OHA_1_04012 [Pleomorphomonas sp. SM30]GLS75925.1 hypothetical protein GCM10007904_12600 [Oharaeibacter diazotrophicus]
MTDDALRERIAALETEVRYMGEAGGRQAEELRELREAVGELRDLLTQARGARWAIVAVIGIGGALASYLPTVFKWVAMAHR